MKPKKLSTQQIIRMLLLPSIIIVGAFVLLLINNAKVLWILMICLFSIIVSIRYFSQQIGRLFYRAIYVRISLSELLALVDVIVAETKWDYGNITNEGIELRIEKANQPIMIFYIIHEEKKLYLHCLSEKISYFDFMEKTMTAEIDWFETKIQEQLNNRHIRAILRREIAVERQLNKRS